MEKHPPSEFFPDDQDSKRPGKRPIVIVGIVLIAVVALAAWVLSRPPAPGPQNTASHADGQANSQSGSGGQPNGQSGGQAGGQAAQPGQPDPASLPLAERVELVTLQRADLDEMMEAPAHTIAWAVNFLGFRPPDLDPDAPWDPPSPERVLAMDDPGPAPTSFVRNIPVPGSDYTVDESIDLVLDDDGETTIGVRYTRFTNAPVENAQMFLDLPE